MSHFGERLRRAFGNAKNAELARKLGVTESAVKNYIEGRIPDATRLLQIKDLTNCNLHWLLTGEEQPDTAPQKVLDLDSAFRDVVRRMIKEELALTLEPAQDIGSVDEFDLEAAVKKYRRLVSSRRPRPPNLPGSTIFRMGRDELGGKGPGGQEFPRALRSTKAF